jgi:hypothetical protein
MAIPGDEILRKKHFLALWDSHELGNIPIPETSMPLKY